MNIPSHTLTCVILTFNEENNIDRVLQNLQWIDRIIIVDSYSTDGTLSILSNYKNVEVHQRRFDTHATQWNFGVGLSDSKWILSLDADYVLPGAFVKETVEKLAGDNYAAFDAEFRFLVFGKALRGNNTTPRPVLFQKSLCTYFDDGHTQRLRINGSTGKFTNKIDHDDRKPLSRWLSNQASYSVKESHMLLSTSSSQLGMISKIRRRKILAPFLIFFYCLFVKGLILDGWRGWYYTLQRTIVEMLFSLRLIEHDSFRES